LCDAKGVQSTVKEGIDSGFTGRAAGKGLFDWSIKDQDEFRLRKQSPHFYTVRDWTMPE
jgi:3-hydroxybutyryl-CoA dehydrogenase